MAYELTMKILCCNPIADGMMCCPFFDESWEACAIYAAPGQPWQNADGVVVSDRRRHIPVNCPLKHINLPNDAPKNVTAIKYEGRDADGL